jgi:acyl carrier protein
VGARILDRLINQKTPTVVAISADWKRARQAGFSGRLPAMFSELGQSETVSDDADSSGSILAVLAATADAERPAVIAEHVSQIVAAVFDCAVDDFAPDDMLDDIGLDSMMAMDFRVRINMVFSIDLPVLEILRGVSVNSLADRILAELNQIHGHAPALVADAPPPPTGIDDHEGDDVDRLMAELSEADLRALLAELEEPAQPEAGGEHS